MSTDDRGWDTSDGTEMTYYDERVSTRAGYCSIRPGDYEVVEPALRTFAAEGLLRFRSGFGFIPTTPLVFERVAGGFATTHGDEFSSVVHAIPVTTTVEAVYACSTLPGLFFRRIGESRFFAMRAPERRATHDVAR